MRPSRREALGTLLAVASCLLATGPALAEHPASIPPSGVHDRPPLARRDAPAGSLARLIHDAAPGQRVDVPPGIYRERVVIDKPLELCGVSRPVVDGGGNGDIIEIAAQDVTVRGFTFRNTGSNLERENCAIRAVASRAIIEDNILENVLFGIDLSGSSDSVVRNNRIGGMPLDTARRGDGLRLWRSDRVLVEGNVIHDGRDAILWYSTGVIVRGNTSSQCRYGFHLMFSDDVVIENNDLLDNSVGVYLMYSAGLTIRNNRLLRNRGPSGYGIGLKEADRYDIRGNTIAGNRAGIYIDGSPFTRTGPADIAGNTVAFNDVGMLLLPSVRGNRIHGNNFVDNLEQISVAGRGAIRDNEFCVGERGNFWSDYIGYDQDRDGVGDYEHLSEHLFENLMAREPKLRIFLLSPAQQAVEMLARAMPAIRPDPKFEDPYPLMEPVAGVASPLHASSRAGLGVVAAALLACAAGVLLLSHGSAGMARVGRSSRAARRAT